MAVLRGRAASPVRPGFIVKKVLSGEVPLETGELVEEAAISDLHSAYRESVRQVNALRPRAKRIKGMTSFSFKTFFKFAQLLGLVELVREEPMKYPPPGGTLFSVRIEEGKPTAVVSTRRIFKLTPKGTEDELSWSDLRRAWQEGWPAPRKLEEVPPAPPVVVPRPPRVPKPPVAVPIFRWVERPSARQFGLFLKFLRQLEAVGIEDERVLREVDLYALRIGDWVLEVEDMLDDARAVNNIQAIKLLEVWLKQLTVVAEGLADRDLPKAISALTTLTQRSK